MFRSQIHFILIAPWITFLNISFCCHHYYMASTVTSEMDRISHCDWQLELTRRRYLARCVSKENGVLSYIITLLLTKLIWSRWWSFTCVWTSTSSWHINKQKKELGQYPAMLTPCLVINPQISNACFFFKQPLHAFPWVPLLGALYNHHDALEPMPISMATSVFCSVKTVTSLTTYSTEFSRAKAVSSGKETWADATVSDRTSFFKEESLLTS